MGAHGTNKTCVGGKQTPEYQAYRNALRVARHNGRRFPHKSFDAWVAAGGAKSGFAAGLEAAGMFWVVNKGCVVDALKNIWVKTGEKLEEKK